MLVKIHPVNPEKRYIQQIAENIKKGKIYILPTDTVYAFATSIEHKKSIQRLYQLKDIPAVKPLSLYCKDFAQMSEYVRMDNNQIFRWMKANLPGPYTLIFHASKNLPNYTLSKQKTVGIRIINHPFIQEILNLLDFPIIGSSVFLHEKYLTYPEDLEKHYGKQIDGAIVDMGPLEFSLSTILDAREYPLQIIREGKGSMENV